MYVLRESINVLIAGRPFTSPKNLIFYWNHRYKPEVIWLPVFSPNKALYDQEQITDCGRVTYFSAQLPEETWTCWNFAASRYISLAQSSCMVAQCALFDPWAGVLGRRSFSNWWYNFGLILRPTFQFCFQMQSLTLSHGSFLSSIAVFQTTCVKKSWQQTLRCQSWSCSTTSKPDKPK